MVKFYLYAFGKTLRFSWMWRSIIFMKISCENVPGVKIFGNLRLIISFLSICRHITRTGKSWCLESIGNGILFFFITRFNQRLSQKKKIITCPRIFLSIGVHFSNIFSGENYFIFLKTCNRRLNNILFLNPLELPRAYIDPIM